MKLKIQNQTKIISLTFSLFLMSLTACIFKKENKEITLAGNNIQTDDTIYMKFPYRIDVKDSLLILFDLASNNYFYQVYTYPSLQYSHSVGFKGSSPDEVTLPTPFQISINNLLILDGAKGILFKYNLDNDSIVERVNFNTNLTVDFISLNDTTIVIEDMSGKNRLLVKSPNSTKPLFTIPQIDEKENNIGYLWRSFMSYNKNSNKIAMATQSGDVIEIYDLKTKDKYIYIGKGGVPRSASQIEGYHDIKWINNEVYALFSGRSREELNIMFEAGKRMPDGGNILKIFDEEGNLLRSLKLDQYINGFTYDETRNCILGISSNSDNPIYIFDLTQ